MPRRRNTDVSSRARAVCIRCHSRKVRCDLEARPSGVCSRCEHEGRDCQLHIGPRKQKALHTSLAAPPSTHTSQTQTDPTTTQRLKSSSLNLLGDNITNCPATNYESPQSYLPLSSEANEADLIIQITQAALCPPAVIAQALIDFYFRELFPFVPVMDQDQEELKMSLLLQQTLYFAGSTMRRSTGGPTEWSTSAIFKRIKTLISLNHDQAPLNTLSSLCVLASWPMHSSNEVVLDNPWQWAGMAIRLGLQLQMHDESTYGQFAHSGRMRRMWWYLFNNDTLQMGCSGRPGMFPINDCNVRLPTPADFSKISTEAYVFCELTSLCQKLREVLQMGKSDSASQAQVFSRLDFLRIWRENLPYELHLFDETKEARQPYHRAVAELHIFYLVTIILTCFLGRRENSTLLKCASIVASSCISRLYEELLYHEDVSCLLPIHVWANLVASIPRTFSGNDEQIRNQLNEKRISQLVLEKMSEKHPSVALVQRRIRELSHTGANMFGLPDSPPDAAPAPITETRREILALFPFPSSFCPTLELLGPTEYSEAAQLELFSDLLADVNNWDWPVEWSSFLF